MNVKTWFFKVDKVFLVRMFSQADDVSVDVGAAKFVERRYS
jgi:hypothetical protein